jgi:streptomycin 3"-adenylyltransferase
VRGLELSVVTRPTTLAPTPTPPFELHLATSNQTTRVVDGHGHPGDPDLLLHVAVCRDHGHPLDGPPPRQVFAPIPRRWLLAGLARELAWARQHGTFEYQVLNAGRAWRFTDENLLCSKLDGAKWAHTRVDDPAIIERAIARQLGQPAQPPGEPAVTAFVQDILHRLHDELATADAQPADQPTPEQHSVHGPGYPHSTDADQRRVGR